MLNYVFGMFDNGVKIFIFVNDFVGFGFNLFMFFYYNMVMFFIINYFIFSLLLVYIFCMMGNFKG